MGSKKISEAVISLNVYEYIRELCAEIEKVDLYVRYDHNFGTDFSTAVRCKGAAGLCEYFRDDAGNETTNRCLTSRVLDDMLAFLNAELKANIRMYIGNYWLRMGLSRLHIDIPAVWDQKEKRFMHPAKETSCCKKQATNTGADINYLYSNHCKVFGIGKNKGIFETAKDGESNKPLREQLFQTFGELIFHRAKKKKQIVFCCSEEGLDDDEVIDLKKELVKREYARLIFKVPEIQTLRQQFDHNKNELEKLCKNYDKFLSKLYEIADGIWHEKGERVLPIWLGRFQTVLSEQLEVTRDNISPRGLFNNLLLLIYADLCPKDAWQLLWFIPARFHDETSAGGLAVFFSKFPSKPDKAAKRPKIVSLLQVIVNAVMLYPTAIQTDAERLKYAINSAIAAIMSRNMSHHIGSHVIPRTTLDALKKRLFEFFFNERSPDTLKEWRMLYEMTRDLKDPLDDYMRRKAEFIAEASTEPVLSTRSAHFFQEIVFPFIRNTALMDTLAANEGFGYSSFDSSSLVIRCFKKEGGDIREFIPRFRHPVYDNEVKIGSGILPCIPYAGRSARDRGTALVSFIEEEDQDVRVALPGPVGEMAFYGILENIIRNTAKHSGVREDRDDTKNLEVHIIICDPTKDSDHYTVKIYENLTRPNQEFDWKQDGQNKTGTLKEMVQHYIEASIIDDQGKLREKAWGIAEMAISASLLKGCLDLKSTSLQVEAHPPVQKFSTTATGPSECLIYTIRMMKARTALLIGFEDPQNRKELEEKGFSFVKKQDEFLESKDSAEKPPTSFQFTVILADTLQKEGEDQYPLDKIRHRLPFRIIIAGTHDTYKRFSKYPCDALTSEIPPMDDGLAALSKWLWKTWLRRWGIENNDDPCCYGIDLYLGQESDIEPTRSWIKNADKFNEEYNETDRPYVMRIWGGEASSDIKQFTYWGKPPLNCRLILDRHGLFAKYSNEPLRLRDKGCYAVIDKSNADFDAVFNPSFSDPFVLPYELLEAGLLRILVLDERIAQKAMDSLGGTEGIRESVAFTLLGRDDFSPTLWHLAARANVFVVTHLDVCSASTKKSAPFLKLELAKNEYRKRSDAFLGNTRDKRRPSARVSCPSLKLLVDIAKGKDDINIAIERVGPDFSDSKPPCPVMDMDAVIVHQGILDSIRQQGKCEKEFLEHLQKNIPWLIIESGRGIPSEVRESQYKFLPFSIVERAFHGERIAKLGLTRALMELTRSR